MENFFKRVSLAFSLVLMVALTGCAITPPVTSSKNNAVRLACTTATTVIDGKAVTVCAVDAQQIDKDTGENKGLWARSIQVYDNLPTMGEVVKGLVPSMGVALIQRDAAKSVAKIQTEACKGGGCVAQPNITQVFSESNSLTQVGVEANVTSGTPASSGACTTCGKLQIK
jgi:hypothetical protein